MIGRTRRECSTVGSPAIRRRRCMGTNVRSTVGSVRWAATSCSYNSNYTALTAFTSSRGGIARRPPESLACSLFALVPPPATTPEAQQLGTSTPRRSVGLLHPSREHHSSPGGPFPSTPRDGPTSSLPPLPVPSLARPPSRAHSIHAHRSAQGARPRPGPTSHTSTFNRIVLPDQARSRLAQSQLIAVSAPGRA
jgi:hypothetical protein